MRLFLDIGHQRIKYGAHDGERWLGVRSCAAESFGDLSIEKGVSDVWVASARDQRYNHALLAFLSKSCVREPRFARSCRTFGDYKSLYIPEQLGVDRFLAGVAAYRRIGAAVIVVDYGTALTIDAIDNDGCHRGGLIMPGAKALRQTLADSVGLSGARPTSRHDRFAIDTNSAIDSGCFFMLSAAVRSTIMAMQKELGCRAAVMLTGGDADLLDWPDDLPTHASPHLVLEGLCFYAQQKSKDKDK